MKTIRQVADEFGISKDKARYWVSKLESEHRLKVGDVTHVTSEGIQQFREMLVSEDKMKSEFSHREITQSLVSVLERELEAKNQQILELNRQNSELLHALSASHALHAGTMKNIADKEDEPKIGFFAKIFGKTKN